MKLKLPCNKNFLFVGSLFGSSLSPIYFKETKCEIVLKKPHVTKVVVLKTKASISWTFCFNRTWLYSFTAKVQPKVQSSFLVCTVNEAV